MFFKGAPSGLRQFLATESLLKIMKNAFYFTLKAFFVPKIFKFLSWFFGHVVKLLDYKDKANFKIHDVTTWLTNNCKAHIAEEEYQKNISGSKDNQAMEYGQLIKYNMKNIFIEKGYTKCGGETIPWPYF